MLYDFRQAGNARRLPRRRPGAGQSLVLESFAEAVLGPIFFEIIERWAQRQAYCRPLFEAIERGQIRRAVL